MNSETWIELPSSVTALIAADLETTAAARVQTKISEKRFRLEDVEYISRLRFTLGGSSAGPEEQPVEVSISPERLEKLRRLCQLWEVDLKPPSTITSHRRFIGPVIVALKRAAYPVLRFFMRETLRKQRDFNAAVVAYLTELSQ